jgi:hypothetical protein
MKHLIIVLIFLISSGLIKAQTPKTVKIGNQVWMSENLGTTSGANHASYTPNERTHTINSATNCTFKFARPSLSFEYIDNRKKCCCCGSRYATYTTPSPGVIEFSQVSTTITYNLLKHWDKIGANTEHKDEDINNFAEFLKNETNKLNRDSYSLLSAEEKKSFDEDLLQKSKKTIRDIFIFTVKNQFYFDPNYDFIKSGSTRRKVNKFYADATECSKCNCGCK